MMSWSSGKDCAWALHVLRQDPAVEVVGLLTTLNTIHDRVAMHSTRRSILEAQAGALGLELHIVPLPWPCSDELYEAAMRDSIEQALAMGVTHVAFGDLFLGDVREYREKQLSEVPLEPLFPIWGETTAELSRKMVESGLEAVITSVDPKQLPGSFAGRRYDHALLEELPSGVDPCGERGEFHSCVLNAPGFSAPIVATIGEIVERDGFVFADVIPQRNGRRDAS